jgi:hypothetical protein
MAYSTISKPSLHFNTKLYTGNGSTQSITGVGFQPDFTWLKSRSNANVHALFDAVRGVTKRISSNDTSAEYTEAGALTAFDSDGFSLGNWTSTNGNGHTLASWNWKAGTTSGITTDGNTTITPSSYSINQTAGFSILKFTGNGVEGAKLAHGLGTTPAMVIIKRTSTTGDWVVYHKSLTATKSVFLNYSDAETARSPNGYIYSPDATNITLSNHGDINNNGVTTVAYCFAEKTGYSKFGSYVGNGNADGSFIYTGFKPAFVIVKQSNSARNWIVMDNKRNSYNVVNKYFKANSNSAEETTTYVDFLSNGFKCRDSDTGANESGGTYIYMAFAEEPLVANVGQSIPATAR